MPQTPSPLRYPGGKSSVWPMVSKLIEVNNMAGCTYAEPYAGGCGLALNLLFRGYVDNLILNDFDKGISSFWKSILNSPEDFIKKIEDTKITIEEWKHQKFIQENANEYSEIELGFSTFFLNRTNRSGIILKAGVIGGKAQSGAYRLDCRFNKPGLISKIEKIQKYKSKIQFYNLDALEFFRKTDRLLSNNGLYCIDPPYYVKGHMLYTNFYEHEDHVRLSNAINNLKSSWVLTYDNVEEIKRLYSQQKYEFSLNYSVGTKRKGTELFVTSGNIRANKLAELKACA